MCNITLFYFHTAFITYDLLESCALDISNEHADNSLNCGNTSCRSLPSKKEEDVKKKGDKDKDKEPPLVKATRLLASTLSTAISTTQQSNNNMKSKDSDDEE